jgi:glycine hydroxymethyltransferase
LPNRHNPWNRSARIFRTWYYPRAIDFARFRAIADEAGALLLADISHIAGLVAAGCHPSPIDHAHFTTMSTYKQLYGPRGGLILIGQEAETRAPGGARTLAELVQHAVFPTVQGTPNLGAVAAKARALTRVATDEFRALARAIVADARALADSLASAGWKVLTGGTDNHIVLLDVAARELTGVIAEQALETCGIVVNKNRIPGDTRRASITSGLRLGTNSLALRGMDEAAVGTCADLLNRVLSSVEPQGETAFRLDPRVAAAVRDEVRSLCTRYRLPNYPGQATEAT